MIKWLRIWLIKKRWHNEWFKIEIEIERILSEKFVAFWYARSKNFSNKWIHDTTRKVISDCHLSRDSIDRMHREVQCYLRSTLIVIWHAQITRLKWPTSESQMEYVRWIVDRKRSHENDLNYALRNSINN